MAGGMTASHRRNTAPFIPYNCSTRPLLDDGIGPSSPGDWWAGSYLHSSQRHFVSATAAPRAPVVEMWRGRAQERSSEAGIAVSAFLSEARRLGMGEEEGETTGFGCPSARLAGHYES